LNALNEMGQAEHDEWLAAADNAYQAFWNEQAIAAIKNNVGQVNEMNTDIHQPTGNGQAGPPVAVR
jgi:hypothetical protein